MGEPRQARRGRVAAFVAVVAALASAVPAQADTRAGRTVAQAPVAAVGCEEHEAWVDGDPSAVATLLPKPYTPVMDGNGKPLVFARAEHCAAATVAGRTAPATIADWGVVVNSPDGVGCASGAPLLGTVKGDIPPICNWYTASLVSDNRRIVGWLRRNTPSAPAVYVPHLTYRVGPADALGRTPFHFAAPARSPSPFSIDDVSSFRAGQISLRGGYWFAIPHGTVKMLVSTDDLTTGPADTVLQAAAGSPLAHLMGATRRTSVAPYDEFGVIRVGHGVLRKQLFAPAWPRERLHRFSGSCSVEGEVTFSPPATNVQTPTVYTYDAVGSCTGRLDGRSLSGVPIHLRTAGHSYASCLQAMSFPPGAGAVVFPGNVRLAYTLDFTTTATELDGTLYGTRSGQASDRGTFLTQRTGPTTPLECGTTGVRKAPMDMSFSTQQDLVSDAVVLR